MPRIKKIKIHHEGTSILIALFLLLAAICTTLWMLLGVHIVPIALTAIAAVFYGFVFNFFRCPKRNYAGERRNMVLSSVDGRVVALERVFEPEFLKAEAIQLSVFMSPLNVHANWFPADGEVLYVRHHKGRFLSAYLPKSSVENERSTIGMRCEGGALLTVRQIAGAMARRIVTYAKEGEEASIDEHLGFIKFGSRVDIFLPLDAEILVNLGDTTRGGITPIAKLHSNS